jgi:hypothetical protein
MAYLTGRTKSGICQPIYWLAAVTIEVGLST